MTTLSIIGGGSWGTALAISFARKHDVTLWGRNAEQMAAKLAYDEIYPY